MNKNINRLVIVIVLMAFGLAYLYYKTLIYYETVNCYSYDLNVYKARPPIYTIKYFYQYKEKYYFDQRRYTSPKKAIPSSKAKVRVCKLNPSKNYLIAKRSSSPLSFGSKYLSSHTDTVDMHINHLSDYYPDKYDKCILANKKSLIYPRNIDSLKHKRVVEALNRVVFCEGSLIETFILNNESDEYKLYLIHYYLNDFSIDSKLSTVYHKLLKEALKQDIKIISIDKNKKEEQKIFVSGNSV